eukprot:1009890_1
MSCCLNTTGKCGNRTLIIDITPHKHSNINDVFSSRLVIYIDLTETKYEDFSNQSGGSPLIVNKLDDNTRDVLMMDLFSNVSGRAPLNRLLYTVKYFALTKCILV